MNIAIIFAGGSGIRMNAKDMPKQFLMVHGKPIIVHTIEAFEQHNEIDSIIVVCIENWISYMEEMKYRYRLDKIQKIVPGGKTGQLSIYNGLSAAEDQFGCGDNIVLIHDGVRPLIDSKTISKNIACVKKHGSAITTVPATETFILVDNNEKVTDIPDRSKSRCARAPQSFYLKDILKVHKLAQQDGFLNMIDSCSMMKHYNYPVSIVEGSPENIKITTPSDFYMFRALYDAKENQQLN